MKKTLLSVLGALACMSGMAQTPSPQWTITQNSNFPIPSAGIRYMDAVSPTAVWASGYDGTTGNTSRAYCWVTTTSDGGNNWTANPVWQSTATPVIGDTSTYVISSVEGMNNTDAWVAAYKKVGGGSQGGIFKTTNSGSTWVNMTSAAMYTHSASFCNWVTFLTPNIGIVDGDPNAGVGNEHELWRTTDGGNNWTLIPAASLPNPTAGEYGITNVYEKFGSTHVWWGTNKGRIYYTTDAGLTWNVTTVNSANSISDIAFYDAMNGICMTYVGTTTNSAVYNTTDGGQSWNLLPNASTDPNYGRNDICGIPGTSWFASCGAGQGNYLLSFSSDNGATWNNWGSTNIQYLTIDFVDPSTGWAGTFSDAASANLEGFYKYNGGSLLQPASANFQVGSVGCVSVAITATNLSTGNPTPTYTWSVLPPTANIASPNSANPNITFNATGIYTVYLTAANSTTTTAATRTLNIASCTGLAQNVTEEFNFTVSPNPGKDVFHVALPNASQVYNITVTNVLGSVVYSAQSSTNANDHTVNLSGNKTGLYFMTISSNGVKTTKKLIIE